MKCIFDTEANGLLEDATVLHCAVFKDIDTGKIYQFYPPLDVDALIKFMDGCEELIGHNVFKYDFPLLKKLFNYVYKGKRTDTLVRSRLQNPNFENPKGYYGNAPHSIEAWGYRVGRGKPEHNDWSTFSTEMLHRCTEDVEIQYLVYKYLVEQSAKEGWDNAAALTNRLFEILAYQEESGWKVDVAHMERAMAWLHKWIDKLEIILQPFLPSTYEVLEQKVNGEYGYLKKPFKKDGTYSVNMCKWLSDNGFSLDDRVVGGPFSRVLFRKISLNSNDETKNFLLSQGWMPQEWNVSKEGIKTSPKLSKDDPFLGVQGSMGKLIVRRVQARHRLANLEGWLMQVRPDGTLPSVVTGLASTGRMKHSIIVNVPGEDSFFGKWMRRCFIAREGYTLVGVDSAGCQNRMLAARVGDDNFTNTLLNGDKKKGTSIHQVNQKAIKDIVGIDVSYHDSKTLNYAFMFGASDNKLGRIVNRGPDIGKKIREAFLSVAPGFKELIDNITSEWRKTAKRRINRWGKFDYYDGYLRGLDDRPIHISSEHKLLVFLLQSDEAIMMSAAYCYLYKRLLARGYEWDKDFRIVIFYHDEYEVECREEIAEEVRLIGEQCIVDAGKFFKIACPHQGDGKIGKNWSEIH